MTRKEKFLEVIKSKGYESIIDLMVDVEAFIAGTPDGAYEKAQNNKNYYSMINGDREFPVKYIVALENILGVRYIDLIDPDSEIDPKPNYDTLKSIAFQNDYEKTKKFALITRLDDTILHCTDEFGYYFMDYILEYSSINCLKYLFDNDEIDVVYGNPQFYYVRDSANFPNNLLNLLCKYDELDMFNKLFVPNAMIINAYYNHNNIYEDEEFVKPIIYTKKIFNSLFKVKEISIDELNNHRFNMDIKTGYFANMIVNTLLKFALKDPVKYEKHLLLITNKAYDINRIIVDRLKGLEQEFKINDKGFVDINGIIVGQVIKYDLPMLPETPLAVKGKIEEMNAVLNELVFKESMSFGRRKYMVVDNKLYLTASNNETQYEMMTYMNSVGFAMIPKFYEHNEKNNTDTFEYKEPYESMGYHSDKNTVYIRQIAGFLKEFHKLSEEKLGKGKVYLHNNLVINNVSLDNNGICAVVNWGDCTIGNPIDDILYVIVYWSGMTDRLRFNSDVLKSIFNFAEEYGLDKNIKIGDELDKYINNLLFKLDKESKNYIKDYETLKFALIFVDLFKDKLNERGN